MASLSEDPIKAFELNIRKARSLAKLQFYIDDMIETGGQNTVRKFLNDLNSFYDKTVGIRYEDIIKEDDRDIDLKIAEKVEQIPDGERKARLDEGTKILEPTLKEIMEILEEIDLLRKKVLVQQAVVCTVTALEVYCSDATASAIELNQFLEKRFHPELSKDFSYKHLEAEGYDGRKALGVIVADSYKFYDVELLSNHLKRLLGEDILAYDSPERQTLHDMIQYRNLITHHAGVVDQEFISKTGYSGKKGEEVQLNRDMVQGWINAANGLVERIEEGIRSQSPLSQRESP